MSPSEARLLCGFVSTLMSPVVLEELCTMSIKSCVLTSTLILVAGAVLGVIIPLALLGLLAWAVTHYAVLPLARKIKALVAPAVPPTVRVITVGVIPLAVVLGLTLFIVLLPLCMTVGAGIWLYCGLAAFARTRKAPVASPHFTAGLQADQSTAFTLCHEVVEVRVTTAALYPAALPVIPVDELNTIIQKINDLVALDNEPVVITRSMLSLPVIVEQELDIAIICTNGHTTRLNGVEVELAPVTDSYAEAVTVAANSPVEHTPEEANIITPVPFTPIEESDVRLVSEETVSEDKAPAKAEETSEPTTPEPTVASPSVPAADTYDALTYRELQGLAKGRSIKANGKQKDIISRLRADDANTTAGYDKLAGGWNG